MKKIINRNLEYYEYQDYGRVILHNRALINAVLKRIKQRGNYIKYIDFGEKTIIKFKKILPQKYNEYLRNRIVITFDWECDRGREARYKFVIFWL